MEHRNQESLKEISCEKKLYCLNDIFQEVWLEKYNEANIYGTVDPNITDEDMIEKQKASNGNYRKYLNEMFKILFGSCYEKILIAEQGKYQVGENGRMLIKFLLKNYSQDIGKKLRKKKKDYKNIVFIEENKLLFYISEFLKEWKEQGGEKHGITTELLTNKVQEEFDISDDTFKLQKAIFEFNQWMEILVNDNEMIPVHRCCAERIGNWRLECDEKIKYFDSKYVLLQLDSKEIVSSKKIGSISKHNLLANEIDYFGRHMYDNIEFE